MNKNFKIPYSDYELSHESWKIILDFPKYQISDLGRIKSFQKNKEVILSEYIGKRGYIQTVLKNGSNRKTLNNHLLVSIYFLGHKPEGTSLLVSDHIDKNKLNNRKSNLRLIDSRRNTTRSLNRSSGHSCVSLYFGKKDIKFNVKVSGKYLGSFTTVDEAIKTRDIYIAKLNLEKFFSRNSD